MLGQSELFFDVFLELSLLFRFVCRRQQVPVSRQQEPVLSSGAGRDQKGLALGLRDRASLVQVSRYRALTKRERTLRSLLTFLLVDHALDKSLRILLPGLGRRLGEEEEQQHREHDRE